MTILSSIKTYIKTYTGVANKPVWVDFLGPQPIEFSIVPLPGPRILETYIIGGSKRQFTFAFQSVQSTADELTRLETSGFFEAFADWLESQTQTGTLPTLAAGKFATLIEAQSWAYLFEQGVSDTGIYQVNCRLEYQQDP